MLRFIVGFSWFALMVSCHTEPGVVVPDISGKDSTQVIDTSVPSDSELTDTSASAFEPMAMIAKTIGMIVSIAILSSLLRKLRSC